MNDYSDHSTILYCTTVGGVVLYKADKFNNILYYKRKGRSFLRKAR